MAPDKPPLSSIKLAIDKSHHNIKAKRDSILQDLSNRGLLYSNLVPDQLARVLAGDLVSVIEQIKKILVEYRSLNPLGLSVEQLADSRLLLVQHLKEEMAEMGKRLARLEKPYNKLSESNIAELELVEKSADDVFDLLSEGLLRGGASKKQKPASSSPSGSGKRIFKTAFSSYTEAGLIGEGGAGRVYKVMDGEAMAFALKILDPGKSDKDKRKRFKNEISFCLKCKHAHVLKVLDHGLLSESDNDTPFYVMHLYEGSLRRLIEDSIPHEKVLIYFSQILDGVEAAHLSEVTHRDLKPENMLYDSRRDSLVIADFGIAHFSPPYMVTSVKTSPSKRLANFAYAAPEQRRPGATVDRRADIFALGLILNEMFTKEIPHGTEYKTIESLSTQFSYLDEVVAMMIRQDPAARPESIDRVKELLIARKAEHVSRQKLELMNKEVIPVTVPDDPLIADPPKLTSIDFYDGKLTLVLSRQVNDKWVWAINNMPHYQSILGIEPRRFSFMRDRASVDISEHDVQRMVVFFKQWLTTANQVYAEAIKLDLVNREEAERQRLIAERKKEEARLRVLASVKI